VTIFLRLLKDKDKQKALLTAVRNLEDNVFEVQPSSFSQVPGAPFAYWVSEAVRKTFADFPAFESDCRLVKQGLATADDFRFVRVWWEVSMENSGWYRIAKGGNFSRYYADMPAVVNWKRGGEELRIFNGSVIRNPEFYFRPGLSWPLRGITFSAQAVPQNCVFSVAGKMAFAPDQELKVWLAIFNSRPFDYLVRLFAGKVGGVQYEVGLIAGIPAPGISRDQSAQLSKLAQRGWSIKRKLASIDEKSSAFMLPAALRSRIDDFDCPAIDIELTNIQAQIDDIAFTLYRFSDSDRALALGSQVSPELEAEPEVPPQSGEAGEETEFAINEMVGLLSWVVGVAFGRFDWRLATGEREAPPEPDPFDPLPSKSPGMLPEGSESFHHHAGILVDDDSHQQDLPRLMEQVLETVNMPISEDVRRWLRKDFFPFHLQRYSKSRRKAPIYWPLSTVSGSYTLWLYYPELTSQTLFTAVNDFVGPKLNSVRDDLNSLRIKVGGRTNQEEKELEKLEDLERELAELNDTLLGIAPSYRPNQDDGVQISAAPLWSLFRHKPWQKVLKDTWKQLEKGDFDWAHLALNYWPDRVLRKCHADRSLAIAHDVESQFWEEIEVPVIRRGKDTGETKLEWQPRNLSESELDALIERTIEERGL